MAHKQHMKYEKHSMHESKSKGEPELANAGLNQGDMSPKVTNFQKPEAEFSQRGFSKTLEYIERQDKMQSGMAHDIEKQGYVGRYS